MIRMQDLSARFDRHSNKYTMCTVQNDQVPDPLMGQFCESIGAQLVIGVFKPSGHLTHTPCPCGARPQVILVIANNLYLVLGMLPQCLLSLS